MGKMVGSARQGWTIFSVMMHTCCVVGLANSHCMENILPILFLATCSSMEGKETRFGITNSVTVGQRQQHDGIQWFSQLLCTTALSPLAGMVAIINIMLGEVIFGGVGAGLVWHGGIYYPHRFYCRTHGWPFS